MLVSRKPFMVEFSGTPEAGKTTTINTVANIMRNANYRVIVLRESAESLPDEIAKGTFQANMWMHFITQAGLLKAVHADADIALIDRGIVDSEFYVKNSFQKVAVVRTNMRSSREHFYNV